MWDSKQYHDIEEEEGSESFSELGRSWAVSMIVPVLFSLVLITLSVVYK